MNLPNSISTGRIALVPVLAAILYVDSPTMRWFALLVYTIGCVSDFLDGYLARREKQISELGRMLDPVADKLLVVTVIFMLVITQRLEGINLVAALIILLREFLVSALREFLADLRMRMHVTGAAKWKTALQMLALGFFIVGDAAPKNIVSFVSIAGTTLLWAAATISVTSGIGYIRFCLLGIERYHRRKERRAKLAGKIGLLRKSP